jgi:hypothetical protein
MRDILYLCLLLSLPPLFTNLVISISSSSSLRIVVPPLHPLPYYFLPPAPPHTREQRHLPSLHFLLVRVGCDTTRAAPRGRKGRGGRSKGSPLPSFLSFILFSCFFSSYLMSDLTIITIACIVGVQFPKKS